MLQCRGRRPDGRRLSRHPARLTTRCSKQAARRCGVQVSGSKLWTLYDTGIVLPLRGQAFDPEKHRPGPPTREFTLVRQAIYRRRRARSSCRPTDETSLHITLGLIGKTWADVMIEAVSAACLASPAFRANLPAGFANAGFDLGHAAATFRTLLDTIVREAQLAPILERLAEDFVTSRRPALYGCLQELETALLCRVLVRAAARSHLPVA